MSKPSNARDAATRDSTGKFDGRKKSTRPFNAPEDAVAGGVERNVMGASKTCRSMGNPNYRAEGASGVGADEAGGVSTGWLPSNPPFVFGLAEVRMMLGGMTSADTEGLLFSRPSYRVLRPEEIAALMRYYIMLCPQSRARVALVHPRFFLPGPRPEKLRVSDYLEVHPTNFEELFMAVHVPSDGELPAHWVLAHYKKVKSVAVIDVYNPLQPMVKGKKQTPVSAETAERLKRAVAAFCPGERPIVKSVWYAWYDRNESPATTGIAVVHLTMLILHRNERRPSLRTRYPTDPNKLHRLFGKVLHTLLTLTVPALEAPEYVFVSQKKSKRPSATPEEGHMVPAKAAKKRVKAGEAVSTPVLSAPGLTYGDALRSQKKAVETYFAGGFDYNCPNCGAHLLKSEFELIRMGRVSKCCGGGTAHTKFMQERFDRLMDPPDFMKRVVEDTPDLRKYVNANWKHLNASFQMVSVTSHDDPTPLPRGIPVQRTNLDFSYACGDLHSTVDPKTGMRVTPKFAQVYTYDPTEAEKIRAQAFADLGKRVAEKGGKKVKAENPAAATVRKGFDRMLRDINECVKSIKTTEERIAEWNKKHPKAQGLPQFRLIVLTNREAEAAKIRDPKVHLHRSNEPSSNNIAVIWVDDEGEPPKLAGVYFEDRGGKLHRLHYYDRNIDPLCYPLLFPYGTQGYTYGISNADHEKVRKCELEAEAEKLEADLKEIQERREREDPVESVEVKGDSEFVEGQADHDEEIPDDGGADDEEEEEDTCVGGKKKTKARGRARFLSYRQYVRYLLQLRGKRPMKWHWLWSKKKLSEIYMLDICQRLERHEMDEAKKAQENNRVALSSGLVEALQRKVLKIDPSARLGKVYMQSVNAKGSRSYMQKAYADAMAIVRTKGNPHLFITFTGNPEWPEIQAHVNKEKGETYIDHPMIVTRVFIDKANAFLNDLMKKHVMGKVAGYVVSTEHQKRGMPHLHCLLILEKPKMPVLLPNATDEMKAAAKSKFEAQTEYFGSPQHVNDLIQSEIEPEPVPGDEMFEFRTRVRELCVKHMLHDCFDNSPCRVDGRCTKGFPKPYSEHTIITGDSMPQYRRRRPDPNAKAPAEVADEEDAADEFYVADDIASPAYQRRPPISKDADVPDTIRESRYGDSVVKKIRARGMVEIDNSRVVPFNPYLLVKYNSHINVEWVFGEKCVNYLMKYIMKGHDLAYVKVSKEGEDPVINYDEYEFIRKVRYMTSIEAYTRIHGYPIVQKSHTVIPLFVHGPDRRVIYRDGANEEELKLAMAKGEKSKLTGFFKLCGRNDATGEAARKLTYMDLPHTFWYKDGTWKPRQRKLSKEIIVRLAAVSSIDPQLIAIRLLLMYVRGPTSFDDLKRLDNGTECATFVEAAEKRGLLDSNESFIKTLNDASDEMTSRSRFRRFFASLIVNLPPPNPERVFNAVMDSLILPPAKYKESATQREERMQRILNSLEYILRQMAKTCKMVGLPEPLAYDESKVEEVAQMEKEILLTHIGDDDDVKRSSNPWKLVFERNYRRLNADQKRAFDRIIAAVKSKGGKEVQRNFFVEGAGGTGKTFLYNTLIAWAKSDERKFRACASTGIASTLLITGATAHSTFWVPMNLKSDTPPRMDAEQFYAEALRKADFIIVDEISMLNKDVLHYIDRLLRDIASTPEKRNTPFGGKVMVLGGDWKQLMPIVKGGGQYGAVAASIKFDPLFATFETLKLTQNMRVDPGAREFAEWLDKVGRGQNFVSDDYIEVPKANMAKDMREMIDFVYSWKSFDMPLDNASTFIRNAILCPKLDAVHRANILMLNRIKAKSRLYKARDYVTKEPNDLLGIDVADRHAENLHRQRPDGFPPYELELKAGAVVVLLRNLDIPLGLCNGTRLQIIAMHENFLKCRVLKGDKAESVHFIPRVKFEYGKNDDQRGLQWVREQFPVQLAFAMSINKAQGQTLEKMGLVLETQAFSHGHIYTALSRVRRSSAFKVLNFGGAPHPNWVLNKVCKEMVADERERLTLIEDQCPVAETPVEGKGTVDAVEPAIPGFVPVSKESVDYVDDEPECEEEVEVEPLYAEQPGDVPETRRRTVKCPYPSLALHNRESDCFLNAAVQLLRFAPRAKQFVVNYTGSNDLVKQLKLLLQNEGRSVSVHAAELRSLLSPRNGTDRRTDMRHGHQDPTEFLDSYLFANANPVSGAPEQTFFNLFAFTITTELTCLNGACPKRVTRRVPETHYQLNVHIDRYKREQDFPALIARLQAPETVDRRCETCRCEKAKMRMLYDLSNTTYLLLRFLVFDNRLNKYHVDFSGHQHDEMAILGQRWNALSLLIHRGEGIGDGHYWTECRASGGEWWKFEDDAQPSRLNSNVLLAGVYCALYERITPSAVEPSRVATSSRPVQPVATPSATTPQAKSVQVKVPSPEKMDTSSPLRKPATSELSSSFMKRTSGISLNDTAPSELSSSKRMKKVQAVLPQATMEKLRRLVVGRMNDVIIKVGLVKLTRDDIKRVLTGGWFTDSIIDAYLHLLKTRYTTAVYKVDALSSYFFDRLSRKGAADGEAKRWLRAVDSGVDLLLLPVHTSDHYSLMYFEQSKKGGPLTLRFVDSLSGKSGDKQEDKRAMLEKVTTFLSGKWDTKTLEWFLPQMPQQNNSSDCGVFLCVAARFVCEKKGFKFDQSEMNHYRWKIACELLEGRLLE